MIQANRHCDVNTIHTIYMQSAVPQAKILYADLCWMVLYFSFKTICLLKK